MDNGIHQLNAGHDPVQDRIRFCFNTRDGCEFRYWITRRYLGLLLKTLGDIAAGFAAGDALSRQARAELALGQALGKTGTQAPFVPGNRFPLGEAPVLAARIAVKKDGAGNTLISLLPEAGAGADIHLNETLTHLIAELLTRASIQAGWQLPSQPLVPPATGDANGKPLLH